MLVIGSYVLGEMAKEMECHERMQSYYDSGRMERMEYTAELGRRSADMIRTHRKAVEDKLQRDCEDMRYDGAATEPPFSDDVLGDEYKLRKGIYGAWEVYKGDISTGFQAIDRNECLKWVKEQRCR